MKIYIKNKKLYEIINKWENKGGQQFPDGFSIIGQIQTSGECPNEIKLTFGIFDKKECEKLDRIISLSKNRDFKV
jgi:hypothetical protein